MPREWISDVRVLTLLILLLLAPCGAIAGVWQQLAGPVPCETFQPMTEDQLKLAEVLFKRMLLGTHVGDESVRAGWAELGYRMSKVEAAGPEWIVLREARSPCRGEGVYLVRGNQPGSLVIQAPHAYSDLYTGEITGGMLGEAVSVLAWNTARRRLAGENEKIDADLARRSDSLFVALTRAMAKGLPRGRLIQIHGFDNKKRKTKAGAAASAILSSGSRWVTPQSATVARCLRKVIKGPVLIYPTEVTELGATRNLHGKTLRRYGHEGFIHVELNRSTREQLRSDPVLRERFIVCLGAGVER